MGTSYLIVTLFGLIGGIVNCILSSQGFVKPGINKINGKTTYELGFFGPIILGGAASLLVYCLGANEIPSTTKIYGICFLSGIGGGSLIKNLLEQNKIKSQQKEISLTNTKMESVTKEYTTLIKEYLNIKNEIGEIIKNISTKKEDSEN